VRFKVRADGIEPTTTCL